MKTPIFIARRCFWRSFRNKHHIFLCYVRVELYMTTLGVDWKNKLWTERSVEQPRITTITDAEELNETKGQMLTVTENNLACCPKSPTRGPDPQPGKADCHRAPKPTGEDNVPASN
ncbi:hypothetical protein EYF80_018488 [Liparis tanakae]|uniref:Uncharacterized protein n=1 Tax=Liparis tanakae TaxID=230148 RepID=A0A4Z2HZS9_9TELE|nr:hypothetical protein EYF80_018488 [Liparis tanakae]